MNVQLVLNKGRVHVDYESGKVLRNSQSKTLLSKTLLGKALYLGNLWNSCIMKAIQLGLRPNYNGAYSHGNSFNRVKYQDRIQIINKYNYYNNYN